MNIRICRNALFLAALTVPLPALATVRNYIGPNNGFWSTPANWSPNGVPVNGDVAYVVTNSSDITAFFDSNYAAPGLNILSADASGFANATINQTGNAMNVSDQEQIGYFGRGQYIQSGGSNSTNYLFLGGVAGANGTYQLSGFGTTLTTTYTDVGDAGNGTFTQSGGTHSTGILSIATSYTGGFGVYNLSNGNVNAISSAIGGAGTGYFQQTGGTVTVSGQLHLQANGSYSISGGSLSAPLINDGSYSQSGGSFTGSGTNNTSMTVSGGSFTVNSGGFTNNSQFSIYGSVIATNGTTTNNGQIIFNGNSTLGGNAAFNNLGVINQYGGILTLVGAGSITNSGNINLASGYGLTLNSNLTNTGTITLNGGHTTGVATLVNRYGGTIRGAGLISSLFDNQGGRLLLTDGTTLITQPFNSSGIIQLTDDSASLNGGAITNSGEITGHGSITNNISSISGGMIEAGGGTLILGGVIGNGAGGILSAPAGGKLFFPGGISASSGLINLSGGYFDNNTSPLSNTGQISGFGTVRTGGLTNNGSVTFTGGFTTVMGNVTNAATKQIKVAYNPALFTGTVDNFGTFKVTSTTATFSGTYNEHGTYISDPSDNYFMDVNLGGTWTGGVGDHFFIEGTLDWSGGSMAGSGAQTFNQGSANLHNAGVKTLSGWTFNNEKPLTLSGGNINMGNSALINNTSTFDFQSDAGVSNSLGGSATFANHNILRKSAGGGTSSIAAMVTNDTGSIDVQAGTLELQGGLSIAAATTLQKMGSATLRIGGPQPHGANSNLNILAGTVRLASDAGTAATGGAGAGKNVTVNLTGNNTTLILETSQDLINLTVPFANAGNQSLDLNTPTTAGAFNALRIYAADLAAAKTNLWNAIKNANAPGSPTPLDGIYDSGSAAHSNTAIGLAQIADAHGDQHMQIRLAKTGDLNLDNSVTIADFIQLASHFNQAGAGITWQEGDVNYDGTVSIADFIALASQFNTIYSADDNQILASFAQSIGVDANVIGSAPDVIGTGVPEPAVLCLLSIAPLLSRRRRHQ